jgi:hypothetical protein
LTPASASEVASGAGVLLIVTVLFFAVGRILSEVGILPSKAIAEEHSTYSRLITYSFFTSTRPAPFVVLAAIYPVFVVWCARFGKTRAAHATILISLLAGILSVLPRVVPAAVWIWCLPAVLIGSGSNSSLGYYVGAMLQLAVGALLLVRYRPRRIQEASAAA